jgi:peptide/nickel transport system ATP-binding protein
MNEVAPVVAVRGLTVDFGSPPQGLRAVAGVDLTLRRGEVLALIGESGSGKTVTLRALLRLLPRYAVIGGAINVDGHDVRSLSPQALADYRGRIASMVFQEPGLAFDPVFTVGNQIAEAVQHHERISYQDARARALDMFERVRIPSARRRLDNYPHELSGGMRQRAMIALALACRPKVLLADEPTTSLDATVQIQILLLLRELQRELGLAVIFVTHDIGVAVEVADRIAVMYAGRIVERGSCREIIGTPAHPYTRGLLASRPHAELIKGTRLETISGTPPDLADLPPGCAFLPRCQLATAECASAVPPEFLVNVGHTARCIHVSFLPGDKQGHTTDRAR